MATSLSILFHKNLKQKNAFLKKVLKYAWAPTTGVGKKRTHSLKLNFFVTDQNQPNFPYIYIYIYISIVIINSHYRSICQPSTSITCWSLGLIVSIYFISDFFWNFIPLFNNGFFQQDELPFDLCINFAPGIPRYQNLLDSNMDYLVASDGALVIEVVSCL